MSFMITFTKGYLNYLIILSSQMVGLPPFISPDKYIRETSEMPETFNSSYDLVNDKGYTILEIVTKQLTIEGILWQHFNLFEKIDKSKILS